MILLGSPISAAEANSAGLVAQLFEPGQVMENVVQTASRLAGLSSAALSLAKEAVCRCKCSTSPITHREYFSHCLLADDLGCDHELERSLYYFAFGTQDKDEGVKAFLEKRAPSWGS